MIDPWQITVGPNQGVPLLRPTDLQVPNPTSFIVQKLLIQESRSPAKRAQDVLYVHDALELFGGALPALNALWQEAIRPALAPKTTRLVVELARESFSTVTDILRNAARIPQDRTLSPERMQAACQLGLEQILG